MKKNILTTAFMVFAFWIVADCQPTIGTIGMEKGNNKQ
jgi:hypothetical protein